MQFTPNVSKTEIYSPNPYSSLPSKNFKDSLAVIISKIWKESLLISSFIGSTIPFVPPILRISYLNPTTKLFGAILVCHVVEQLAEWKKDKIDESSFIGKIWQKSVAYSINISRFFRAAIFGFIAANTIEVSLHELAHATCQYTFFATKWPTTFIKPFESAVTICSLNSLSKFGERLGFDNAFTLATLAGPLTSLTIATSALTLAERIKKTHPEARLYLMGVAVMSVFHQVVYAMTAIFNKQEFSNDFAILAIALNTHPAVMIVGIIAIPIITAYAVNKFFPSKDKKINVAQN